MSTSTRPSVPPGMVALDINEVVNIIHQRPERHKVFDALILPKLLSQHRERLSSHMAKPSRLQEGLIVVNPSKRAGLRRKQRFMNRMERSIGGIMDKERELSVWAWLKATKTIMKEMEESGCLSDENQADFEDLERLIDDFEEDVWRVRGELEEVKMLMKSDGQEGEGIFHKRLGVVVGSLVLLITLMIGYFFN